MSSNKQSVKPCVVVCVMGKKSENMQKGGEERA